MCEQQATAALTHQIVSPPPLAATQPCRRISCRTSSCAHPRSGSSSNNNKSSSNSSSSVPVASCSAWLGVLPVLLQPRLHSQGWAQQPGEPQQSGGSAVGVWRADACGGCDNRWGDQEQAAAAGEAASCCQHITQSNTSSTGFITHTTSFFEE